MIRDPYQVEEDDFEVPVPTFSTGAPEEEPREEEVNKLPSLVDLCVENLSKTMTIESAVDTLTLADTYSAEELKVNALKFLSLNITSLFESDRIEKLFQLPLYLIKDLQNFIKI
jgi:hypothetical protein